MKLLAALALALSCCAYAASECVEVRGVETPPSSRNARITVLLNGKPQENVKLIVTMPGGQSPRSFVTNSKGNALLKGLPIGTNCMAAIGEGNFRADLCLQVSEQSGKGASSFTLALADGLPSAAGLVPEKTLAPERVRELDGVVLDQSGAFVTHAEVRVFERGLYPMNPVTKIWTDQEGRFSAPLNPGTYVILIRMMGFKPALRVIEISPEGREGQVERNTAHRFVLIRVTLMLKDSE